jgi:small subunit ribosomal protein S9
MRDWLFLSKLCLSREPSERDVFQMGRTRLVISSVFGGGALSTANTPAFGNKTWFHGTGRRKESIARVFLRPGTGKFTVNGRTTKEYFPNHAWEHDATEPLKFTSLVDQVDVVATAKGGGVGGQSGAVRMGLSRAISRFNPELRPALRKNGFLTRDSRMKERKKYGQKGARKRFQFTKR